MAKAKQPGSTGAEQGAQVEQIIPAPSADQAADPAPQPVEPEVPAEPAVEAPEVEALVLVKARVLVSGAYGECNDVVEVEARVAKSLPDVLDTASEAVAYAESLTAEQ